MPPVSYFTPVHRTRRAGGQNQKTKRKKDDMEFHSGGFPELLVPQDEQTSGGETSLSAGSSSGAIRERAVAREVPNGHQLPEFALEASDGSSPTPTRLKHSISKRTLNETIGKLQPPILAAQQYPASGVHGTKVSNRNGARQRHLTVLTAILHRSLLEHDYARAGRAWGMILRSELDGHSVDLRNGCRWGLGAEILLRQRSQSNDGFNMTVEGERSAAQKPDQYISTEGFEKAKQYYDRLSLQYPYHKSIPNATGPLDFRFAIFCLWIYASIDQDPLNSNLHRAASAGTTSKGLELERAHNSQEESLSRAREISEQLDELLSSPPFSDSERFKNLKTMIDLWKTDLMIAILRPGPDASNVGMERSENVELTTDGSCVTESPTNTTTT